MVKVVDGTGGPQDGSWRAALPMQTLGGTTF
jgi:hypothetical protein